ncbi:MAG: zinc-binding alcohol dehydrogenase [Chloroflexi bacterium]|nr:zinc-binding alcohol dehydrogenase [Chloroflexota bacterium]
MKNSSVLFTAPGQVELQEVDSDFLPLGDHEVLTRTQYSLISAGTELACLAGVEAWFPFPNSPGYATVGEVVETGAAVSAVQPGDMVYSMGRHRQYHLINLADARAMCVKVPAGMSLQQAVFARLAVVAFTALRISTIELGDYVGLVGLGVVGNLAAQLSRLQGGRAIGLDLSAERVALARECGIDQALVIDPASIADEIAALTNKEGIATLIEATGNPRALPPVLPLLGRFGEVILLGTPRGAYETDLTEVLRYAHLDGMGNITFKGAHEWRYSVPRDPFTKHSITRNAELALELIRDGDVKIAPLHSHTLPPQQAEVAYRGLQNEKDKYIGVVFDWTDV